MPSWGGTEFGFYYMNCHSRLPTINGITGCPKSIMPPEARVTASGLQVYYALGVPAGCRPDGGRHRAAPGQDAAGPRSLPSPQPGTLAYPEDIKLYGLSWNAQLGTSGIAFQGEVSYRQDNPLQVDDVELLFAALSPISVRRTPTTNQVTNGTPLGLSEVASGYRFHDHVQLQFTLTKIASNLLGADQAVFLGEFGFNKVFDMPSKDELRFEGPGTYTSGNPAIRCPVGLTPAKNVNCLSTSPTTSRGVIAWSPSSPTTTPSVPGPSPPGSPGNRTSAA